MSTQFILQLTDQMLADVSEMAVASGTGNYAVIENAIIAAIAEFKEPFAVESEGGHAD